MDNKEKRLAVLIDADNVSVKYIKGILNETANHGTPTVKRIYGDWTKPQMAPWKQVLLLNSITPIQQYGYTTGKNSTDAALIIDAMDILYGEKVDGFCLVSSDSDFTRLAARLREAGMYVLGMGEQKTPQPFVSACEKFKYLEILNKNEEVQINKPEKKENAISTKKTIISAITSIVDESSGDDGWANLGEVGSKLSKRYNDFDTRNYNYKNLSAFVTSLKKFDVELRKSANTNHSNNYIRNKKK